MFEILSFILVSLLVAWPLLLKWADKVVHEHDVIVFILLFFSGLGIFAFTCRLVYLGMKANL